MTVNTELLNKIKVAVKRNFSSYLGKVLDASSLASYGMDALDSLRLQLPETGCANCGRCCNSISIYSIEYHRIIRYLMQKHDPGTIRKFIFNAMRFDLRQAKIKDEKRIRCSFRDEDLQTCLVHPIRPFACRFFGLLKEDGTRECENVFELNSSPVVVPERMIESLQIKILENSEGYEIFKGAGKIYFFPFEFWLYRTIFSPERAIQIYREILVPMSTPLKNLWSASSVVNSTSTNDAKL